MPKVGHYGDQLCWIGWSGTLYEWGYSSIYKLKINYFPLYLYVLKTYGHIYKDPILIASNIYKLKYISLLFDFLSGIIAFHYIQLKTKKIKESFYLSFFYFFNFFLLYNTLIYNQVDSIYNFFLILSIYFLVNKRIGLCLLSLLIGVNLKLQIIIFFPFIITIILIKLYHLETKRKLMKIIGVLVSLLALQILIFWPYIKSNQISEFYMMLVSLGSQYPFVTFGAFNFWYIIFPDIKLVSDQLHFFNLTYKFIGLVIFSLIYLSIFILWIKKLKNVFKENILSHFITYDNILLSLSIISLGFFMFSTEMHERYVFPGVCMLTIYFIANKMPFYVLPLTICYALNLEHICNIFKFDFLNSIFLGKCCSVTYLIYFVVAIYFLVKELFVNSNYRNSVKKV